MNRSLIIDTAELNNHLSYLNITCYFDIYHEDMGARFRLLSGEDVLMYPWQRETPKTPRETVDYLKMVYQFDAYYIVDSSNKSDNEDLHAFLNEYGLSDLPFKVGEHPEQYKLGGTIWRPGNIQKDHNGIPVVNCDRLNEAPFPRRLPEPLNFQKGRSAWFPVERNGERVPEIGYMKELQSDDTVTMKNGKNVSLSDCWRTKKECEQHIQKTKLLLTENDLSFAEETSVSL